jgi:predicted Zn-dependent protease with MMP-like domain
MINMRPAGFEELVQKAILELPEHIRQKMDNVEVVVEKKASAEQLAEVGLRSSNSLLGLYQGVPQTAWGRGFGNILPDKISIFQEPIEKLAESDEEIIALVKNTVWHEIAHHFGFSEKGVRRLENKRMVRQSGRKKR